MGLQRDKNMKNLTLGQLLTYAAYISVGASLARIVLHHLRDGIAIYVPYDSTNPSRFWLFYAKLEATAAWLSIALGKFAKKGEGGLILVPDTKEGINKALETISADSQRPVATLDEAVEAIKVSERKDEITKEAVTVTTTNKETEKQ
jgi:hypothetical protein